VRRQCEDIALSFLREPHVAGYLAQRFGGHAFPPEAGARRAPANGRESLFMVRVVDELVALARVGSRRTALAAAPAPRRDCARGSGEPPPAGREADCAPGPEAQRLLEAASVLGSEFTVPSIAAGLARIRWRSKSVATNWHDRAVFGRVGAVHAARREAGGPLRLHP